MLGTDHEAKLMANQADAVIAAMLATFGPVLQSFKAADLNLRIALGEYKGETQSVEELFQHLDKILLPSWEIQIFTLFPKGTSNATVKFMLPATEGITVQTDVNGQFEVELGTFTETVTGTVEVTAAGYLSYGRSGSIEPGEDIDVEVSLQPKPAPPALPMP